MKMRQPHDQETYVMILHLVLNILDHPVLSILLIIKWAMLTERRCVQTRSQSSIVSWVVNRSISESSELLIRWRSDIVVTDGICCKL